MKIGRAPYKCLKLLQESHNKKKGIKNQCIKKEPQGQAKYNKMSETKRNKDIFSDYESHDCYHYFRTIQLLSPFIIVRKSNIDDKISVPIHSDGMRNQVQENKGMQT